MTYQCIFSIFFPKYYTQNNIFGVQNKTAFAIHCKECIESKDKIKKGNFQLFFVPTIDLIKQLAKELALDLTKQLAKESQKYNREANKFGQKLIDHEDQNIFLKKTQQLKYHLI